MFLLPPRKAGRRAFAKAELGEASRLLDQHGGVRAPTMTMLDFEELYERAKWGGTVLAEGREPLSQAEVDAVAAELSQPEPQADPETLIQTLGRAGAVQYRGLVESFLTCAEDPMLARRALEVLCDDWNMTADYLVVHPASPYQ